MLTAVLGRMPAAAPEVIRNDQLDWNTLSARFEQGDFDNVVISPGPGTPERDSDIGASRALVMAAEVCKFRRLSSFVRLRHDAQREADHSAILIRRAEQLCRYAICTGRCASHCSVGPCRRVPTGHRRAPRCTGAGHLPWTSGAGVSARGCRPPCSVPSAWALVRRAAQRARPLCWHPFGCGPGPSTSGSL